MRLTLARLALLVPLQVPAPGPSSPAPQQPAAGQEQAEVGETVVTAPRAASTITSSTAQVQVISGDELRRTGERSLPRAIGLAAGIFVQETNLGGGAPILRGLIGNQILIVVDGVRLNDSTTRAGPNQSLNGIDPATVERVEIVRGPASVAYGSDALGGAILIWTKTRKPAVRVEGGIETSEQARRIRAVLDTYYQSVTDGGRASLAVSGATTDHGWLAIGGLQEWNELESASGTIDNTGYHGNSLFGSWEYALAPSRSMRVSASQTRDFDVPRTDRLNTGFGQTQPADAEHDFHLQERQRYVLAYDDRTGGALGDSMQARVSFRHYEEDRHIRSNGSSTRRLESDTTDTLGLGVDWKKALGDSQLLTYGVDVDYDEVESLRDDVNINTGVITPNAGAFAPDSRYVSTGVFLQDELLALRPFEVTAGVRYSYFDFAFDDFATTNRVDGNFDAVTASLQVGRALARGLRLIATVSQGFRAPNLADLAKNATFAGGTELANPDLDPEKSLMGELALEVVQDLWNGSLAVYHNGLSDTIGRRLISAGGPAPGDEVYQRENVGSVSIYGVEARVQYTLGAADSPYSLLASAEWLEGKQYDDFVDPNTGQKPFYDEPASRIPPLHGVVGVRYAPAVPWHHLDWAELQYVWAQNQDELSPSDLSDPRIDPNGTDGWDVWNVDVGGPIGALGQGSSWTVGIHNILDESYRVHGSGLSAPGVGFVVGARFAR